MFDAEVIEYCLPNGQQRFKTIPIAEQHHVAYDSMFDSGCRLEMEILHTGERSVTVTNDEMDVDIEVVPGNVPPHITIGHLLERKLWKSS